MKANAKWEGVEKNLDKILQIMDDLVVTWEHHEKMGAASAVDRGDRYHERQPLPKKGGCRR